MNRRIKQIAHDIITGIAATAAFLLMCLFLLMVTVKADAADLVCQIPDDQGATVVEWQYASDLRSVWRPMVFTTSERLSDVAAGCWQCRYWNQSYASYVSEPQCVEQGGCHND